MFEKEQRLGGMLENGLPSFRLEKDVVQAEIDVLREMGVQFRCGVEVGKDVTLPAAPGGLPGLLCGRGPAVRRQAGYPRR